MRRSQIPTNNMEISQEDYGKVVELLKNNQPLEAAALLQELVGIGAEEASAIVENISATEGIELLPTPRVVTAAPPRPSIADMPAPSIPASSFKAPTISRQASGGPPSLSELRKREDELHQLSGAADSKVGINTKVLELLLSLSGIPLIIIAFLCGGISADGVTAMLITAAIAVAVYFLVRLSLKERGDWGNKRWVFAGAITMCAYIAYFAFVFDGVRSSPYVSDRYYAEKALPEILQESKVSYRAAKDLPAIDIEIKEDKDSFSIHRVGQDNHDPIPLGIPVIEAGDDLSGEANGVQVKLIAVGVHDSALEDVDIMYINPMNAEQFGPTEFMYNGNRVKFQKFVQKGTGEPSIILTSKGRKIGNDMSGSSHLDHRLLRAVFDVGKDTSIKQVMVVERGTKRLLGFSDKSISAGIGFVDVKLKSWHASEWDIYVDAENRENRKSYYVPFAEGNHELGKTGVYVQIPKVWTTTDTVISRRFALSYDKKYNITREKPADVSHYDHTGIMRIVPAHMAQFTNIYGNDKKIIESQDFARGAVWLLKKEPKPKYGEEYPELSIIMGVPSRFKFPIPTLKEFATNEGVTNLFDVHIPYFMLTARTISDGFIKAIGEENVTAKDRSYSDDQVPPYQLLEEVAQMVNFSVDPAVYKMDLEPIKPTQYENTTPYLILKDYTKRYEVEVVVDEERRTLSLRKDS